MSDKYEQWREADRQAHAAEALLHGKARSAGRRDTSDADGARARELRARADSLFDEAMNELNREVNAAIRQRSALVASRSK